MDVTDVKNNVKIHVSPHIASNVKTSKKISPYVPSTLGSRVATTGQLRHSVYSRLESQTHSERWGLLFFGSLSRFSPALD